MGFFHGKGYKWPCLQDVGCKECDGRHGHGKEQERSGARGRGAREAGALLISFRCKKLNYVH